MIVSPLGTTLLVITQGDHAHLASDILSLVREPSLIEHPRRRELLLAVREHDNGWREVDAAPSVDPESGAPLGFRDVGEGVRRRLWTRGCTRLGESAPYAALLVTLHALDLHRSECGDEAWAEWLTAIETLRDELADAAGESLEKAMADHEWLALADACSLALCERIGGSFERCGLSGRVEEERLILDPFPLAGATTFEVACRQIPRVRYRSDLELGLALARAPWGKRSLHVTPD